MSKADRIWALIQAGRPDEVIAKKIGCRREYVRVVRQRRTNPDNAYRRYDARLRELAKVYGDRDAAHEQGKAVYRRALQDGLSVREASWKSGAAYQATLRKTTVRRIPRAT